MRALRLFDRADGDHLLIFFPGVEGDWAVLDAEQLVLFLHAGGRVKRVVRVRWAFIYALFGAIVLAIVQSTR